MLHKVFRTSLACLFALAVASCGWHPRGSQTLPSQLHTLQLVSAQPEGVVTLKLRRALQASGVTLIDGAGDHLSLHLGKEDRNSRKVSLDRQAHSAEQEMRITVVFDLRDASGAVVYGPRTAVASRVYAYDPNSIIAKQAEESLIVGELEDNIVGQIFRQLRRAEAGGAP